MLHHSFSASAFPDRRSEDVRVQAVVIAELEFDDIERQALLLTFWKVPVMPRLMSEAGKRGHPGVADDASDDASLAALGASDNRLADSWAAEANAPSRPPLRRGPRYSSRESELR
jgi:hypothetical protein